MQINYRDLHRCMGKFRRTNYTWGVMANPSSSCPDAALCCAHLRSFFVLAFDTLFQLKMTGTKGWFLFVRALRVSSFILCKRKFSTTNNPHGSIFSKCTTFNLHMLHLRFRIFHPNVSRLRFGQVHRWQLARHSVLVVPLVVCQYLLHQLWSG